jgi:hypothetical protein
MKTSSSTTETAAAAAPLRPQRRRATPVVDPTGKVWPSQIEAARAYNLWPSHLGVLARTERHGWRLAPRDDNAKSGGAHRKTPVVDPSGRLWPSQIAAAKGNDMWPQAVATLVRLERHGWRLARPDEVELDGGTPGAEG